MTDGSGCGRVGCALMEEGVPPEKGKDGAAGLEPEAELEPDELEPEPEVEVSEVDGSTLARMMSDAPKSDAESLLVFARPMGIFEGLSEEEALTRCKEALAATPGYDISDACDWLWEQAATEEEDAAAVRLLGWDPPKLELSTTELLWGVGADTLGEQTQELVLSNPSGSDVCFTSKISRRARFALSPSNCVVAAGGSVPVRVTLLAMESLPEPDERTDRILLLAAWRGGRPSGNGGGLLGAVEGADLPPARRLRSRAAGGRGAWQCTEPHAHTVREQLRRPRGPRDVPRHGQPGSPADRVQPALPPLGGGAARRRRVRHAHATEGRGLSCAPPECRQYRRDPA
eukprot:COSAG01_NODE_12838_length_1677_cov_1.322989_1_plen_344_part_00